MTEKEPGPIKLALCGLKSPLGWLAEKLVGRASECWCCSFWRGGAYGAVLGLAAGLLL